MLIRPFFVFRLSMSGGIPAVKVNPLTIWPVRGLSSVLEKFLNEVDQWKFQAHERLIADPISNFFIFLLTFPDRPISLLHSW
jgi:hypothetical protein